MIIIAVILFSLCLLPIGLLTKEIIDEFIPHNDQQSLLRYSGLIFLLILVHLVGTIMTRRYTLKFTKRYIHILRVKLCEHVLGLSRKEAEQNSISDSQVRIVNHVERIDILVNGLILTVIPAMIMVVGLSLILFIINAKLATLILITTPILGVILLLTKRTGTNKITAYHQTFESFNQSILATLRGLFLIQDEVLEHASLQKLDDNAAQLRVSGYEVGLYQAAIQQIQEALISIMGIGVLVVGGFLTFNDQMTFGGLLGFYFVVFIMRRYFNELIKSVPMMQEGLISYKKISQNLEKATLPRSSNELDEEVTTISLADVDFWYRPEKVILHEVNIQFDKGKTYLITGENGSGKTSLFNLLTMHYSPNRGEIFVNGSKGSDPRNVRLKLGILPQDPVFFESTIKENILLDREVEETVFKEAVSFANVDRFVLEMPQQYDTPMGDSGVFLSGGQKQKVALARTLVKQPDFLLLDEPTNHLDRKSIDHLIDRLTSLSDPPGIIIISHDKSMRAVADFTFKISDSRVSVYPQE